VNYYQLCIWKLHFYSISTAPNPSLKFWLSFNTLSKLSLPVEVLIVKLISMLYILQYSWIASELISFEKNMLLWRILANLILANLWYLRWCILLPAPIFRPLHIVSFDFLSALINLRILIISSMLVITLNNLENWTD